MINKEILGGVSPLKAKRQSSRGGKNAAKATATSKRRAGFAKAEGKRGGGGRNVGGYNAQTRFKAAVWSPPGSGGTSTPNPRKPVTIGEDGSTKIAALDPDSTKGREERLVKGEEPTKTNEFADNCLGANGEKLTGTSYYSEIKKMQIACAWDEDAKDDGSFDKMTGGTKDKNEQRTWTDDGTGKVYTSWEEFQKETT